VVEEIAIEIDVVLVGASQVGEAVGIERVDEKQRDASGELCLHPELQQSRLDAGRTERFDAVRAAADDQQRLGILGSEASHVGREKLAAGAALGMREAGRLCSAGRAQLQERESARGIVDGKGARQRFPMTDHGNSATSSAACAHDSRNAM